MMNMDLPTVQDIMLIPDEDFTLTFEADEKVIYAEWKHGPESWGCPGHGATVEAAILRCRLHLAHAAYAAECEILR